MNATFCSNCGAKHTYTYAKPKFCSSCGFNLGPELKTAVAKSKPNIEDEYEDEDDEDGEFSNSSHVPTIRKLEVEVEKYAESTSFTLGSIFGQVDQLPAQPRRRTSQSLGDFVNDKPRRGEQA